MPTISLSVSLRSHLRSSTAFVDPYEVNSFSPDFVLDFKNSVYKTGGTETTLSSAVTHARAGNATMVDSDGLIKWAPHNLVAYSEDFTNSSWIESNNGSVAVDNAVAPDGTTTASTLTIAQLNSRIYQHVPKSYKIGEKYTFAFWVRSDTVTSIPFGIQGGINGANNAASTNTVAPVTSTWNLVEFEFTVLGNDNALYHLIGYISHNQAQTGDVEIWHPHAYRSDLGGMVNNSAQSTGFKTYVPTTSSAVYAPRVGHYAYNGSAWVNEGILHESEARTNLAYPSDISGGSWTGGIWSNTTRADWNGIPNGAVRINTSATSTNNRIYNPSFATSGVGTHCLSFYYKSGSTVPFLHVRYNTPSSIVGVCINTSNDALTAGYYDGSIATNAFLTQGVVDVGGGWRRFYGTTSETNSSSDPYALLLYLSTSATSTTTSFGSVK